MKHSQIARGANGIDPARRREMEASASEEAREENEVNAREWMGDPQTIIRLVSENNPKLRGRERKARGRFALYRDGMTVEEYGNACRSAPEFATKYKNDYLVDIKADVTRGYIRLEPPA